MDGLDPPENMVRCMANNYSPLGFWRSWHRSFNLWIVRYLYIPLGGAHRLIATSVLIFTFVALWHDLSPRLLAWGWLVVLFILPEVMARKALPPSMVRATLFQYSVPRERAHFLLAFYFLCFLGAVWRKVVVSPSLCYWRSPQHSDDDGREPRRICCWYGWCPVPCISTSEQLER
jgi:D-alanyl-lipoteichoic acid acyltransferase DltB (MBOAT superfamily)